MTRSKSKTLISLLVVLTMLLTSVPLAFNASAAECDIDKQGRLTIPQELKVYAGIEKDLVTVGSNKVIEVWSKEYWDDQLDPDSGELIDASEAAKGLEIYGF